MQKLLPPIHVHMDTQVATADLTFEVHKPHADAGKTVDVHFEATNGVHNRWHIKVTLSAALSKGACLSLVNLGVQDMLYDTEIMNAPADVTFKVPQPKGTWDTFTVAGPVPATGATGSTMKGSNVCFMDPNGKTSIEFDVVGPNRPKGETYNWPGVPNAGHANLPPGFPPGSGEH